MQKGNRIPGLIPAYYEGVGFVSFKVGNAPATPKISHLRFSKSHYSPRSRDEYYYTALYPVINLIYPSCSYTREESKLLEVIICPGCGFTKTKPTFPGSRLKSINGKNPSRWLSATGELKNTYNANCGNCHYGFWDSLYSIKEMPEISFVEVKEFSTVKEFEEFNASRREQGYFQL